MAGRKDKIDELKAKSKKLAEEAARLEKECREENMMRIGKLVLEKYVKDDFANFSIFHFKTEVANIVNE